MVNLSPRLPLKKQIKEHSNGAVAEGITESFSSKVSNRNRITMMMPTEKPDFENVDDDYLL